MIITFNIKTALRNEVADLMRQPKYDKFSIFWAGRMNTGSKRVEKVIEMCEKFFMLGNDVKSTFTCPSGGSFWMPRRKHHPSIEFRFKVGREDYLPEFGRHDVWLNASIYEGFSATVAEQLSSGIPGLLPREPWVRGMLADFYDEYPFLYDGVTEGLVLLDWIYNNKAEANAKAAVVKDYVWSHWDVSVVLERVAKIAESLV